MAAREPAFIDTNVLVYLFANDAPRIQACAEKLYVSLAETGSATVSTQVLQEFYAVATRKLEEPITAATARLALHDFCGQNVVQVTPALIMKAAQRSTADQLPFWDATIVESALAGGCRTLYSADLQNGRKFGPLCVVNPFV